MLLNLLQPSSREDLAISCLLEEDQKDHIDQADWTLKNPNKKTKGSITTYLDFKGNRSRGYFHRSNQKHSNKNRYNPEMLEINEDDCFGQGSHTSKGLKKQNNETSCLQNQVAYWCSKVNWTSTGFKEEQRSQPRVPKKMWFGYETNSPQNRHTRYEVYEKTRDEQYKTNLIYNILKGQAERIKQQQIKTRSLSMHKADSAVELSQNTLRDTHWSTSQSKINPQKDNLARYVQQSMRQTMKKIWSKNHSSNDLTYSSNSKPVQGNKGAFVREMLINIQRKKELPAHQDKSTSKGARYLVKKEGQNREKRKQRIYLDKQKETSRLAEEQRMNANRVINLNAEAQRVYNSRSVNRRRQIKQVI